MEGDTQALDKLKTFAVEQISLMVVSLYFLFVWAFVGIFGITFCGGNGHPFLVLFCVVF